VHRIAAHETNGELEALLLESQLVKELLPYQNKLLRRTNKLVLAMKEQNQQGYLQVRADTVSPEDIANTRDVLAVYDRRSKLRASLEAAAKDWDLCPKLLGLEKSSRACFWSQLGICKGACAGKEAPEAYNARLLVAFTNQRLQPWPYRGPIIVEEQHGADTANNTSEAGLIIDRWCVIGKLRQEPDCEPVLERKQSGFDLDTYNILKSYLAAKRDRLKIHLLSPQQAASLGLA
jgi:DNA polymerase-3 subunit epsilon